MKAYIRRSLLVVVFVLFSSSLIFQPTQGIYEKLVSSSSVFQNQVVSKTSQGLPVRLRIPSINVDAAIEYVGFTSKREMEVPKNTVDVGWFKLGPRPGERGSAVIAGHFNRENGNSGVFANLYKLKQGDKLYTEDNNGIITTFVVSKSRIYDSGYANDVFSRSDGFYLNLVTCDGVWDGVKKSYTKRLVVFADIIK